MKKRLLFLSFMFCCLSGVTFAQPAWTNYNLSNSQLAADQVHCILIENDSTTWIGTDYGLSKLVNGTFTNFYTSNSNIPANSIRSLAIDSNKTLWVGTFSNGLAAFDGTNWTGYNSLNSSLPDDFVRSLAIDTTGDKWIGTTGGLVKLDSLNNWTIYTMWNSVLGSNNIAAIYVDTLTNNKWVGTVNGGLLLIEKDTNLTSYTVQTSGISDNTILSIDMDSLGNIQLASPANGLIIKLSGFGWFTYNLASSTIPTAGLTSVKNDSIDQPWIGTFDKGLLYKNGSNFIMYDTSNSPIEDEHITFVTVDRFGKVWFGTETKGLYILDPSLLTGLTEAGTAPNVIVYPNPVQEELHYMAGAVPERVEIYDLNGRLMVWTEDSRQALATGQLHAGIYQVKFYFGNGSTVTRKMIRQ